MRMLCDSETILLIISVRQGFCPCLHFSPVPKDNSVRESFHRFGTLNFRISFLTVVDQISVSNVCRTLHQAVGLHFQTHMRNSTCITDYKCCKPPIPEYKLKFDLSVDSSIDYYFCHVFDETEWPRCQSWYEDLARYDLPLHARILKNQDKRKRRELHKKLVRDFRRR